MKDFKIALTNHRPLRYSHIKIEPAQDYVLTADPWSYLHSYMINGHDKRRSKNKSQHEAAIFYLGLAQNFYRASKYAELPAKATLLYYGMLNLVKVWLSIQGVELEKKSAHHGLSADNKVDCQINIGKKDKMVCIFDKFCKELGFPVNGKSSKVCLTDAISCVPELQSTLRDFTQHEKQRFLSVNIEFQTDSHTEKKLLTCVSWEKRAAGLVENSRIHTGKRQEYFHSPKEVGERMEMRSKIERKPKDWQNVSVAYKKFLNEFDDFNVCSMLTRNGYQYYLDLQPSEFHHLAYSYMIMFYLGSIARYKPSLMDKILKGPLRQSVTEACAICPNQFLYQLAGRITDSNCVIPFALV